MRRTESVEGYVLLAKEKFEWSRDTLDDKYIEGNTVS